MLSACAWATARALDPGPAAADWLDGFCDLEVGLRPQLEEMLPPGREDGQPEPTWCSTGRHSRSALLRPARAIGVVEGSASRASGFAATAYRGDGAPRPVDHDFLNSFIADDLARVADAAARGEVGSALRDYLRPTADSGHRRSGRRADPARRGSVRNRSRARPPRALARKPRSPPRAGTAARRQRGGGDARCSGPAFCGQRAAGNGEDDHAARSGRGARDRASGAPGGAGQILSDAFLEEPERWKTTRYQRTVHRFDRSSPGSSSSWHRATTVRSRTSPSRSPPTRPSTRAWREPAQAIDYFPALAERAMGAGQDKRGARERLKPTAWGLVAARLGNSKNRKGFVKAVWWTESSDDDDRPPPPTGLARSPQSMGETSRGALVGRCRGVIRASARSCGGDSRRAPARSRAAGSPRRVGIGDRDGAGGGAGGKREGRRLRANVTSSSRTRCVRTRRNVSDGCKSARICAVFVPRSSGCGRELSGATMTASSPPRSPRLTRG